jgi:hypothetical protein
MAKSLHAVALRRFMRLRNAFSKKLDNHKAACALHFAVLQFLPDTHEPPRDVSNGDGHYRITFGRLALRIWFYFRYLFAYNVSPWGSTLAATRDRPDFSFTHVPSYYRSFAPQTAPQILHLSRQLCFIVQELARDSRSVATAIRYGAKGVKSSMNDLLTWLRP